MDFDDAMKCNKKWIDSLGTEGHSGDESNHRHRGNNKRCWIRVLPWRSKELTSYLRALDSLHLSSRYKASGRPMKGTMPHERYVRSRLLDEDSAPVCGLPLNFYDANWIEKQDSAYVQRLKIQYDVAVDLSIPASVAEYVDGCILSANTNYLN
jgi:hypothetical protein